MDHLDMDDASQLARVVVEYLAEGSDASSNNISDAGNTVHMSDHTDPVPWNGASVSEGVTGTSTTRDAVALPPLPPQPSPLLCPHRTFLACLILASKFMQDRSYSNHAWAKLAGLPPREIGRCERAVGNALEWQLWVGKDLNVETSNAKRSLLRSRSDGHVLDTATTHAPKNIPYPNTPPVTPHGFLDVPDISPSNSGSPGSLQTQDARLRSLRRCATVPCIIVEPPASRILACPEACSSTFVEEPVLCDHSDMCPSTSGESFLDPHGYQAPSPQWSTPLTYSPMSTSSTLSDGSDERTVQLAPLADFSESSSNARVLVGCPEAWCDRPDVDMVGTMFSKPHSSSVPGPSTDMVYPEMVADASAPYFAPMDTGTIQLPSFSVGFPFYG
ncbi:hypothetical protein DAEQUDRAFT_781236 [Daedalea quercina L-15889]|uniref:Cyclin N-terminal domain-containing protein n=1 Tax=Daedalea quercina L-15889 TaxID=1314783 RepID=A0A165RBN0_9APHY|nr:hypothetical protein DAEQUDRAFT_781236 [Daedalea quercina L-15889]